MQAHSGIVLEEHFLKHFSFTGQEPVPQGSQDEPQEVLAFAETRAVAPGENQPGPLLAALLPGPAPDSSGKDR